MASGNTAELGHLAFWLSAFWSGLYALRYYRNRSRRISTLPTLTPATWPSSTELFRSSATRITLSKCHLRYQSTAWNALHQSSSARLIKRGDWRRALRFAYDVGTALGVLGMVGSVLLLVWTTMQLASSIYSRPGAPDSILQTGVLHKRDAFDNGDDVAHAAQAAPALQLIIPGLTTPLHHLPLLLIALLTTQVLHECGHAVSAALDALPLTSAGLGLTVLLPSAFVAFPSEDTETLSPRSRARLVSAGAFHNLLFWLALCVAARVHTSDLAWPVLGYRDLSQYGRVVVGVDEHSPLYGHLPLGAVIYKVGDESLASQHGAEREWETLMSRPARGSPPSLGWCVEGAWFSAQDDVCCSARRAGVPSLSCFATVSGVASQHCVDPLRFLQPPRGESLRRCVSTTECGHDQLCIRPRGDQELLSLTVHIPSWLRINEADMERTIVWQGDRSEIFEEVETGDWLPNYRWLPMALPFVWGTFFSYLKMLTLSLYFFNLLPLPILDGGQLFDIMNHAWTTRQSEEFPMNHIEDGVERVVTQTKAADGLHEGKVGIRRVVHIIVYALLGLCITLSLANTYF
ncbi:hypothetical protein C8Q79DRAFT_1002094 [Trametes meyenii]|nr:hypothetical protein C8Q79DRAFT_1002094 [Trametes meyenii]